MLSMVPQLQRGGLVVRHRIVALAYFCMIYTICYLHLSQHLV